MNCFWHAGPGVFETGLHKVIYHPSTGLCVQRKSLLDPLTLGPCTESEAWSYTPHNTISPKGTYFCLHAKQVGKPATLSIICLDPGSTWEIISDSKMHLSSKADNGTTVCLDVDSSNTIVTNTCKCLSRDKKCDPASQWFKLVDSTRSSTTTKSFFQFNPILDLPGKDFIWKFFGLFWTKLTMQQIDNVLTSENAG